ncbi:MAG: GGDEF domain-containing protein [Lachnospiraceae bacterium]|nr:GGDEF domain-containing protein [Lachnospiraceae bacterium]
MEEVFKKHKIAVLVNGWSAEFLEQILEGIRKEAAKENVDIFVFTSYIFWGEPGPQSMCQLNVFHLPDPKEFDGAIMLTNTFNIPAEKERVCALFQRAGIPMVSTEVAIDNMPFLGTDNYQGMRELTEHLVNEHEVRRIVYISGIEGNVECAIRRRAVEDVLHEHGLELVDNLVGNFGFYKATTEVDDWIAQGKELPDAFVCANDLMAIGAANSLHLHGIDVPGKVIVTGFDDIREARSFYPMIATVTRHWDTLGEQAFITLRDQIINPDPGYSKTYDSEFVPSESCGCEPPAADVEFRLDSLRNGYAESNKIEMLDIYYQEMRIPMSKVESKEQFYEVAERTMGTHDYIGEDYCICTEPLFFELDDDNYPKRIRGYSEKIDLLYGKSNGKSMRQKMFNSRDIYPGYRYEKGHSNLYIVAPLNNMDFVIGYVVIRNDPSALYDLRLRKWVADTNTLLITIRQYIFAQQTNRKLKEIYMTDFLTNMYNRTGCENVLYTFINDEREKEHNTLLVFADINCMKFINDDYGHLSGDLAIKATSEALRRAMPEGWLFGRYGGDEFIAVGRCENSEMAESLKADFVESMKKVVERLKLNFTLSASAGYTFIKPDDDASIADFIKRADESMYEEKQKMHREIEEARKIRMQEKRIE